MIHCSPNLVWLLGPTSERDVSWPKWLSEVFRKSSGFLRIYQGWAMSEEPKHFYEFGSFRLDPDKRLLLQDNRPVPLQPKAFETLLMLVQHSEAVVLKDDLMKSVWPDTFVEESNLAQNIFVLRKTLGSGRRAPLHRYRAGTWVPVHGEGAVGSSAGRYNVAEPLNHPRGD